MIIAGPAALQAELRRVVVCRLQEGEPGEADGPAARIVVPAWRKQLAETHSDRARSPCLSSATLPMENPPRTPHRTTGCFLLALNLFKKVRFPFQAGLPTRCDVGRPGRATEEEGRGG